MKKFTLTVAILASIVAVSAQNLLTNGSFESWTGGKPDGWSITTPANATISEGATFNDGTKSFKVVGLALGTYGVSQSIPVTAGKTYTVVMNYFIEAGDGTDARIWCNFKTVTGSVTKYWTMALADSLALKGPNATQTGGYFPDVKGSWQTYTYDVVAPAGFDQFSYEFRTYKSPAIVYWDNMQFGEKGTLAINEARNDVRMFVNGKSLIMSNVTDGTAVEVFNSVGKRVSQGVVASSSYNMSKLTKGMYIVRVGSTTKKVTL